MELGGEDAGSRPYNPGVAVDAEVHRWTLEEYHQLVESGGFDEDSRIELIDGLLVDMGPRTPEHERPIAWLNRKLQLAIDPDRFEVLVAAPLTLETSEPEPDLAVVAADAPRPYHPGTAALVIEVSVSSLRRDLRVKPRIYAEAGVPAYWVIDVEGRRAIAHSQPGPEGYARIETVGPDGELTAAHIGLPSVSLDALFSTI
jgi:Uma2 family endonuclease